MYFRVCGFVVVVNQFFFLFEMAQLVRTVRLRVPAGSAKPGPAIGQV